MKKYLLILMSFFMVILGITSFSNVENEKVPNELIINNPKKEVTTIESLKNREHGEMNISVTKINPIPITGIERDGKLEFELPELISLDDEIIVSKDISFLKNLLDIKKNVNTRLIQKINLEKKIPYSLNKIKSKIQIIIEKSMISRSREEINDIYIFILGSNSVKKIFKAETRNNYLGNITINIDKRAHFGNLYDSNLKKANRTNDYHLYTDPYINMSGALNHTYRGVTLDAEVKNNLNVTDSDVFEAITRATTAGMHLEGRDSGGYYWRFLHKGSNNNGNFRGFQFNFSNSYKMKRLSNENIEYSLSNDTDYTINIDGVINKNQNVKYDLIVKSVGEPAHKGKATVDLSKVPINGSVQWSLPNLKNLQGKQMSIDYEKKGTIQMTQGSFVNIYSQVNTYYTNIGAIKVTDMNTNEEKISFNAHKCKVEFSDYSFEVDITYKYFSIYKKTDKQKRYLIEFFTGDMGNSYHTFLGSVELTIDGTEPQKPIQKIDIGSVKFKVDSRLKELKNKVWIFANGKVGDTISNNNLKDYSEMIKVEGNFNLKNNEKITIKDAEMNGKIKDSGIFTSNGIDYIGFRKNNDWKFDASAIPKNITLGSLKNNLVINKNNKNGYNNKFILKNENSNEYSGDIIEEYSTDTSTYIGNSTLDLSNLKKNQWASWNNPKSLIATSSSNSISIKMEGNELFNFRSGVNGNNKNIITKLVITANGITDTLNANGTITTRLETTKFQHNKIGKDENGLFISKLTSNNTPITYEIKGYYKDILLGTTNITITNQKNSFELVGDGILDFENMVYTSDFNEYRKEKLFKVRNPSNVNVKFSVAPTSTIKNGKSQLKLENIKVTKKNNRLFLLEASTRLEKGTKPGKYTGEIQVIVDIDGTGK